MILAEILFGAAFTLLSAFSLGRLCLVRIPAPAVMALPAGAAVLSTLVCLLLLAGAANRTAFVALGCVSLLGLLPRRPREKRIGFDTRVAAVLAPYAILYLVHALAPELQPDAAGYHLGLVAQYARTGAFPDRVDFYGILPQGMDMLYLFAYTFGRHSAAKLVHLGFLAATAPMIVAIGRRFGVPDTAGALAAAVYLIAPVVGIAGTSAYTDAALACVILGCVYFLATAIAEDEGKYLAPAGMLAGFAYAIKLSALLIPAAGALAILAARRQVLKRSAIFTACAAPLILPWMLRAAILAENPLAPLFNAWFRNPHFSESAERALAKTLRTYEGFTFATAPWELTIGGASQGILGPAFLLLPVALLALRSPAGRRLWAVAAILIFPWLFNTGTRFLMPALPFLALALIVALPSRLAWAFVAFHAITSWPSVVAAYERPGLWCLGGFPWEAALRIQPEPAYLRDQLLEFRAVEMIRRRTPEDARILALVELPAAYLDREVWQFWQSTKAIRAREQLAETYAFAPYALSDWTLSWRGRELAAVRFRLPRGAAVEWEIHEIELLGGGDRIPAARDWLLEAWPNLFEAPQALDGSLPSRWRTSEAAPGGAFFEIDMRTPVRISGAVLTTHRAFPGVEVFGKSPAGEWTALAASEVRAMRPAEDLRRPTIESLKRAGFDYLVIPAGGSDPHAALGRDLVDNASWWGVVHLASFDTIALLRL